MTNLELALSAIVVLVFFLLMYVKRIDDEIFRIRKILDEINYRATYSGDNNLIAHCPLEGKNI